MLYSDEAVRWLGQNSQPASHVIGKENGHLLANTNEPANQQITKKSEDENPIQNTTDIMHTGIQIQVRQGFGVYRVASKQGQLEIVQ